MDTKIDAWRKFLALFAVMMAKFQTSTKLSQTHTIEGKIVLVWKKRKQLSIG